MTSFRKKNSENQMSGTHIWVAMISKWFTNEYHMCVVSCVFSIIRKIFSFSLGLFAKIKVIQAERFWSWTLPRSLRIYWFYFFFSLKIVCANWIFMKKKQIHPNCSPETCKSFFKRDRQNKNELFHSLELEPILIMIILIYEFVFDYPRYQANDCVWRHSLHNLSYRIVSLLSFLFWNKKHFIRNSSFVNVCVTVENDRKWLDYITMIGIL